MTLMVDVMFVNGVDFLTTLSRSIRLFTAEHVPYRTTAQLSNFSKKRVKLYYQGGFSVWVILITMEFKNVAKKLGLIEVNTTAD